MTNDLSNESNTKSKDNLEFRSRLSRQVSLQSTGSSIDEVQYEEFHENPVEVEESRSSGNVSSRVYASYLSAGGTKWQIFLVFFTCIFTQILGSSGEIWMAYWYTRLVCF